MPERTGTLRNDPRERRDRRARDAPGAGGELGVGPALRDLAGAFAPLSVRRLQRDIDERLAALPVELNEYGFDAYGFRPEAARTSLLVTALLYRHYFRATVHGIEGVPAGRVLLVCNHAGQLPFDGAMLSTAMLLSANPPRMCRPMGEFWIPQLPFVSVFVARGGGMVGTPENCVAMLDDGEAVMVFPEGVRGMNKTWDQRYQLQRFGTGFVRLALQTNTPIVPVALVGSEEQQPSLFNLSGLARRFGMPALPITPTFPLLGPLGLLPMPVRYHFHFGEPLHIEGDPTDDEVVDRHVAEVRGDIESLLEHGLAEREGVFR